MPVDRILIVDDEEAIREIVSSMLTAAHYKCSQAGSGLQALALLESGEEFELVLSDLMMADLDGIGLLERTKERFPDLPVVMVTAVHKEGLMEGTDLSLMEDVVEESEHPVCASGGIGTLGDLRALEDRGVASVVIGMALYTGALEPAAVAEEFAE